MSIYLCTRGHLCRSQWATINCRHCCKADRRNAIPACKPDAAGRLLLTAAEIVQEQHAYLYEEKARGGNMHPIGALYIADCGCKSDEYETAVRRLFDCCGVDFMDHEQVENIDDLVAAAFWEIESDHAERRSA